MMAGATPVFADLDPERLTMSPAATEAAITPKTAAILPVHLYGQPADMPALAAIASRHNLALVEDACQAHLGTAAGRPVGTFGAAGTFSFYPTKNLGALGDGGAVTTSDRALADKLKRLRNGGQIDRYHHLEFGVNSRLDEMQAGARVQLRVARSQRAQNVGRQASVAGACFDQVERWRQHSVSRHLRQLRGEQHAEERSDVDAGEEIAGAAGAARLIVALRGPFRVRALVFVRWPRTGRPFLWRWPR